MSFQGLITGAIEFACSMELGAFIGIGAHALYEERSRSIGGSRDVSVLQLLRADRVWGGDGWILTRGGKLGKGKVPLPGLDARKSRIRNGEVPVLGDRGASGGASSTATGPRGAASAPSRPAAPAPGKATDRPTGNSMDKADGRGTGANMPLGGAAEQKASLSGTRNASKKAGGSGAALSPFNLFPNHRPTRLPGPPKAFDPAMFP